MKRLFFVAFVFALTACGGGNGSVAPPQGGALPPVPAGTNFGTTTAAHYTLTDLGPGPGAPWITPRSINNSGVVVLQSAASPLSSLPCTTCGNALPRGLVYRNGAVQTLPALAGDDTTFANDVDNAGDIVGGSTSAATPETAVLWKPDLTIVNLGTGLATPSSNAEAGAISESGQFIAGISANATSTLPTFFDGKGGAIDPCGSSVQGYFRDVNNAGTGVGDQLLSAGGTAVMTCAPFTVIAMPSNPAWLNFGFEINNSGTIAGRLSTGPAKKNFHPFVFQDGKITDLGTLFPNSPDAVGAAFGLNNGGMIVGWSAESGGTIGTPPIPPVNPRAWVYANGKMVDLNTLLPASCANWTLITAEAINDNGQIVGVAFVGGYPNGNEHAYVLTPQP